MKKYKKGYEEMMAKKFVKLYRWEQVKGYVLDLELIRDCPDHWDKMYIQDLSDYVEKVTYWSNESDEEHCFEDVWDVVEYIEENSEENFDEWIKSPKTTILKESEHNKNLNQFPSETTLR